MRRILRFPDPAEGSPPKPTLEETPPDPAKALPKSPEAPARPPADKAPADPPAAAKIVLEGQRTEREAALERDLKARETRLAELEEENRALKTPVTVQAPQKSKAKERWFEGGTFFE